jgi:hypothetical protein
MNPSAVNRKGRKERKEKRRDYQTDNWRVSLFMVLI